MREGLGGLSEWCVLRTPRGRGCARGGASGVRPPSRGEATAVDGHRAPPSTRSGHSGRQAGDEDRLRESHQTGGSSPSVAPGGLCRPTLRASTDSECTAERRPLPQGTARRTAATRGRGREGDGRGHVRAPSSQRNPSPVAGACVAPPPDPCWKALWKLSGQSGHHRAGRRGTELKSISKSLNI